MEETNKNDLINQVYYYHEASGDCIRKLIEIDKNTQDDKL